MMWLLAKLKEMNATIGRAGPALFLVALVVLALIVAGAVTFRGCSTADAGPDYLEDARQQILDTVDLEQKKNEARIKVLEAELYDLRIQVDDLDAELKKSAEIREEIHDAIDHANSIDDVDRILRDTIPGVGGRHD